MRAEKTDKKHKKKTMAIYAILYARVAIVFKLIILILFYYYIDR